MKIKKSLLVQIIREELQNHILELMEKPEKKDKDTGVVDAASEPEKKSAKPPEKKKEVGAEPKKKDAKAPGEPKELPVPEDPETDKSLEKDVAAPEDTEDAADVTGGKIADEVTGKSIQSITMDPKSKILPGAQEIVVTFNETTNPLKILVTKTGAVKFFYSGGLHNSL